MKTAQKVTKLDSVRIVKSRYSWFIESLFLKKKITEQKKKRLKIESSIYFTGS